MTETAYTVNSHEHSARLDVFLTKRALLSRAGAKRLIDEGSVRIDGRIAKKGTILYPGQLVVLAALPSDDVSTPPLAQPELPLSILFESPELLVVNKPAGWPTHPLRAHERDTLASAVIARFPTCATASPAAREGGACHRLDRFTSGAVIFARTAAAWDALRVSFSAGLVEKEYLALVVGVPPLGQDELRVELPILRAPGKDGHKRVITAETPEQIYHPDAQDAVTRFVVEQRGATHALLRAHTTTGRRHQVRAHLSHLALPLLGDTLYGAPSEPACDGYFLHAARISFSLGAQRIDVQAPLPTHRQSLLSVILDKK